MAPEKQTQKKDYSGVKKDPLDLRDLMYEGSLLELPLTLDNRTKVPFILDQKKEGACTGFGLAAVVNYLLHNHSDTTIDPQRTVSARMLYEMAKRYDEWDGEDYEGSSIRGAMKGWQKHGVCDSKLWPYSNRRGMLTPEAQLDALQRPLGNYFRVRHLYLEQMHCALREVGILYASAQVHEGWHRVDKNGRIPFHSQKVGAHAFAIIGYDGDGFWIQNSWGNNWGLKGFCHIGYDDWLENSLDCWVARLGVPTLSTTLEGQASANRIARFDYIPHEEVVLSEIRPHFINLENDGRFSDSGRYSTNPDEVEKIIKQNFINKTTEWGSTPRLALYAHGGLNSEKSSASRIASMLPYFLDNHIYPLHFMWETGLGETVNGIIQDAFRRGRLQSWTDDMKERFLDLLDEAIELGGRSLGRPLWKQMKQNAKSASQRQGGALFVAEKLQEFINSGNDLELHLIGHSAGSIFHGYLLPKLADKEIKVKTLTLFAPACTMGLLEKNILPYLGTTVEQISIFNLTDPTERDDNVGPVYNKSLLYLVSESFEKSKERPLAGMQKFWAPDSAACSTFGKPAFESERGIVYTKGGPDLKLKTESTSHGGFDNDEDTLNSMLRIILGQNRLRKYYRK